LYGFFGARGKDHKGVSLEKRRPGEEEKEAVWLRPRRFVGYPFGDTREEKRSIDA
jgi:hypothetical protein